MSTPRRDPVREQFWRAAISAWRASGGTIREYCRLHGLKPSTFDHWHRELRVRDAAASRVGPSAARPVFVPVTVLPAAASPAAVPPPAVGPVDVRCPSGHVVTVPMGDGAVLRLLFAALAAVPPAGREGSPC